MGFFGEDHYDTVNNYDGSDEHKAKLSHEVLGGAAAFAAAKAYEDHKAKNGEPDDHAKAKEVIAGLVGAGVDRLAETKGLDFIDREKAKRAGEQQTYQQFGYN